MNRHRKAVCVGLFCCALPLSCAASCITLETRAASRFRHGQVGVTLDVENKGTAPALSVQAEVFLGARSVSSAVREQLPAGETFHAALQLGPPPLPDGVHTAIVRIRYTDGPGHRFMAQSLVAVITAAPDPEDDPLSAHLTVSHATRDAEAVLSLASRTNVALPVHVRLALPSEFDCPAPELDVTLLPGKEQPCRFRVRNVSALPGSVYAIFAVADCVANGQHRSVTAAGSLAVGSPSTPSEPLRAAAAFLVAALLAAFVALQFRRTTPPAETADRGAERALSVRRFWFDAAVLAALFIFTLCFIPPKYLLLDTTAVGGDTPAHNYLASHLQEQLLHGRIASWAGGWWCGFPMFQFYFCLPYLLVALGSAVLPFNVAFKIVSVSGILALPSVAYVSARCMRLPRPGPVLLAIAAIPFLFDVTHTMWGVNVYSTLAGMIANSLSFAVMLPALASAFRDADEGRFRIRTVLLFAALMASHFFTTVIAGLTVLILPMLHPRAGIRKAFAALAAEGALAAALMAWWFVPLFATREFAVQFGSNWDLRVHAPPGPLLIALATFAAFGAVLSFLKRDRFVPVMLWMLLVSAFLLAWGFGVSPVFVNVRLWPFVSYALWAIGAAGVALLAAGRKATELVTIAALAGALVFGVSNPSKAKGWAQWNYEGLQSKRFWPVFEKLVLPLDKTPGRLANDLHEDNDLLGSSRVFECVPHLIRKPILEGGIVGSAVGSLFSYYVQGETSKSCAGFPEIVRPAGFDFTNATRHLELFNVKHFIARGAGTKAALAESPDWRKLAESHGWELYELTTHEGRYVSIPANEPMAVRAADFQSAGLEWIYTIRALEQPFVLLAPGQPDDPRWGKPLSHTEYLVYLRTLRNGQPPTIPARPIAGGEGLIRDEEVSDRRIRFRTAGIGLPHIVKCGYFPNWKARGAKAVYMATPHFMLVYPEQEEVELYYGYTLPDRMGLGLSALALTTLGVIGGRRLVRRRKCLETGMESDY